MSKNLIRHLLRRYDEINGSLLSKGLCFSFLLGLLPLLFIAISFATYIINVTPELEANIINGIAEIIPMELLSDYLEKLFDANWQSLSIVTIFFFFLFSLNLFNALGRVLRTILSRTKSTIAHHNVRSFVLLVTSMLLFYLSIIIGTGRGMVLGEAMDDFSESMPDAIEVLTPLSGLGRVSGVIVGEGIDVILVALILVLLYYIYSDGKINLRTTSIIAIICSIIWEVVGLFGTAIIQILNNRFAIFGTVATPIIFIIYLRIFADILIFSSLAVDYFCTGRDTQGEKSLSQESPPIKENIDHEYKPIR